MLGVVAHEFLACLVGENQGYTEKSSLNTVPLHLPTLSKVQNKIVNKPQKPAKVWADLCVYVAVL